jgi:hypothetical protein
MKSFKVRDGKVLVDGVIYGLTPTDSDIRGKAGRIQSINISGKGMFFPYYGTFNDGSVPVVDETPIKKGKLAKTELKESNGLAVDESGNLIKKRKTTKKK